MVYNKYIKAIYIIGGPVRLQTPAAYLKFPGTRILGLRQYIL